MKIKEKTYLFSTKFAAGATYRQPCDGSEVVDSFQAFAPAASNWDHLVLATSLGGCSRLASQRIPWLTGVQASNHDTNEPACHLRPRVPTRL
jgi:hypothetical protein